MTQFLNRREAGKILAEALKMYARRNDVIVLALPRGGVPVAFEVAHILNVPLDIFIVRKIGVPFHEELAMGAIATGGVIFRNEEIIRELGITKKQFEDVEKEEKAELERREKKYRGQRPFPELTGKTVILVDDGIATGASMRAAVKALREKKPANIVIAVPVAEITTCESLAKVADKLICLLKPTHFSAVGAWYEDFEQTTDEEVVNLISANDYKS